ncbi:hypothetical protein LCGC14_2882940, partial [marine sediment metagenome]
AALLVCKYVVSDNIYLGKTIMLHNLDILLVLS